jgi:dihydropteroate synthase
MTTTSRPPKVMGIVNVTPDSFSDGGAHLDPDAATAHGRLMVSEGATILDVGGESTRPGSTEVGAAEEIERVVPVVEGLAGSGVEISVDTSKLAVGEASLDAGATIVNDVTALRRDPELASLCAERGATVVLVHMLGTPLTMQKNPTYRNVLSEVKDFLLRRIEFAVRSGVPEDRILVDPGIGFGKTLDHNLALLRGLEAFSGLGAGIVVGASRKSFIGELGAAKPKDRLGGSLAAAIWAAAQGASVVRVHDVAATVEALTVTAAIAQTTGRNADRVPPGRTLRQSR